ncbi:60 kDa jasmonate-induced protein isoform X2 [Setaria viridis]|nr:uncharacterized protein LOC117866576 isoform X2 [Setaria viridis]XP_034606711.1 uncharacterized protein LOC117866576 isoform X2 [Setaria viridis]TKV99401.1 hypothetical protein SEVIR_8G041100v2 [Setaria viridis]
MENVLEVTFPIEDVATFERSITTLRRTLANHPDSGDILNSFSSTLQEHPLLARNHRARSLRIKLQVAGEKGMSSATLFVQYNNLYCLGFMNQNQVCYELSNPEGWKLPAKYNAVPLDWGITYESILNVTDGEVEEKLDSLWLGKNFAADAVRELSCFSPDGDAASARQALAGLIVMVCESAKMNPLHKTIADGWNTGAGFTKRLMAYIGHWELISSALLDWKDESYGRWTMHPRLAEITGVRSPIDALNVIHLVRNFTVEERELLYKHIYESS